MAESKRKSKPREIEEDEHEEHHFAWWMLVIYLLGAIEIIFLMIIVSGFLQADPNNKPPPWVNWAFLGVAGGMALLFVIGKFLLEPRAKRNAAE
jgi:hypothetical protein